MAAGVGMVGPLAPFRGGFSEWLDELGYTSLSSGALVRLMADVSTWLASEGLDASAFTGDAVEEFLIRRRAAGRTGHLSGRGLAPLLRFLRERGVVPEECVAVPATRVECLLEEYHCYLVGERGLAAGSVRIYVRVARLFLDAMPKATQDDLELLCASDVTVFVLGLARAREHVSRPRSATNLASASTGVRSLLGFLFLTGRTPRSLAAAVPSAARWRGGALPRAVDSGCVSRMLASCDRVSAVGRRDFAIVLLLARLGLRVSEVAGLSLDDVDWRAGEMLVRGKGGRGDRLPVPHDVGEAIAAYLRDGRPPTTCRSVLLRVRAPHGALTGDAVAMIVARACERAGLERVGAHRLRHTAATEMLHAGASLREIGQVLRHDREETTAIYAKVDVLALAGLARPWPGAPS